MKTSIKVALMVGFSAIIAAAFCGCGGGGGTTSSNLQSTGVEAVGLIGTAPVGAVPIVGAGGPGEMNPNYPNAFQVPSSYSVALAKMELLKGTDDATPYVVFDTGSVTSPRVISLTASNGAQSFGGNTEYPTPGTYTHLRVTLAYQELTVNADVADGTGYSAHKFRVYNSSAGSILQGDVLMLKDGVYNWIKGGQFFPVTGSRPGDDVPGTIVRMMHYVNDNAPDPEVSIVELAAPMVVPASPSGKYTITATFDVTSSPDMPGSTGVFAWDDVTADGQFKPAVPMGEGGDGNEAEVEAKGPADWTPLAPVITFNYSQSQ